MLEILEQDSWIGGITCIYADLTETLAMFNMSIHHHNDVYMIGKRRRIIDPQ